MRSRRYGEGVIDTEKMRAFWRYLRQSRARMVCAEHGSDCEGGADDCDLIRPSLPYDSFPDAIPGEGVIELDTER